MRSLAAKMLELDDVSKSFAGPGEVVRAVDGISLGVDPGDLVALVGPSGSGKTTLLLLIAAMLVPDRGTIRFAGRPLDVMSEHEAAEYRRSQIGFVFQTFNLLAGMSALDNVAIPLRLNGVGVSEARARARELLDRIGLGGRADHQPTQLSGGECQRVAVARALAIQPKLVLADEPTGNLDTQHGDQVLSQLRELASDRRAAVILVTHDAHAAAYADRILELHDGRVRERLDAGQLVSLSEG